MVEFFREGGSVIRRWRSQWLLAACRLAVLSWLAISFLPMWASDVPRQPKVRAITAFVRIDRDHYAQQIQQPLGMLRAAKSAFEKAGYQVESIRITTQPFP